MYQFLSNITAVIFDLDGTLTDSMHMWRNIDIEFLGQYGLAMPENLQTDISGMDFKETAVYFKQRFSLPDSVEAIMRRWNEMAYEQYAWRLELKPGVRELLELLKKLGIPCGMATSNSRPLAEAFLQRHGLTEYITDPVMAGDTERGKPAPDVYLLAARRLKTDPSHCLAFEDLPEGIMAAKAAGMYVCAVQDDFSRALTEEKIRLSDIYIKSMYELIEPMRRIKGEAHVQQSL